MLFFILRGNSWRSTWKRRQIDTNYAIGARIIYVALNWPSPRKNVNKQPVQHGERKKQRERLSRRQCEGRACRALSKKVIDCSLHITIDPSLTLTRCKRVRSSIMSVISLEHTELELGHQLLLICRWLSNNNTDEHDGARPQKTNHAKQRKNKNKTITIRRR